MKEIILLLLICIFVFSVAGFAGTNGLKPQSVCPITGGKIDKNLSRDYRRQQSCCCCSNYEGSFLKKLEKLLK